MAQERREVSEIREDFELAMEYSSNRCEAGNYLIAIMDTHSGVPFVFVRAAEIFLSATAHGVSTAQIAQRRQVGEQALQRGEQSCSVAARQGRA